MDAIAWGDKPRRTFDEMALGFLDDHARNLRPQSLRRYEISLKALTPHFEGLTLDQITRATLAAYEADRRRLVTASTVRRDLACLSSMFSWAIAWEWREANPVGPFLKARAKRGLKESASRTRYLSREEEVRLLAAAPAYLGPMIAVAIDTGLRLEEQLSLTWDQVSLGAREILVELTKSGKSRTVPILPRAGTILGTLPRHIHSRYVFCKSDGTRYGKLTRGLAGAAKRAGIAKLQWHDLRRTCGCRLLQDHGLDINRVKEWLGHASVVQTERAYAFLRTEDLHAAIDARTKTGTGHADS